MSRKEFNIIIKISIVIAFAIAISILLISGISLTVLNFLKSLSYGLASSTIFWWWYLNKAWKFGIFKQFLPRPNLDGTWSGILHSNWKDSAGVQVAPKQFFLVIRQNFLKIHVTSFTDNYIGSSYTETIVAHTDFSIFKLIYVYGKETSDPGIQQPNQGVSELRIINDEKIMKGVYWTNIQTMGTLDITKVSSKHIDTFEDGLKLLK
jgi:hypothetical protein